MSAASYGSPTFATPGPSAATEALAGWASQQWSPLEPLGLVATGFGVGLLVFVFCFLMYYVFLGFLVFFFFVCLFYFIFLYFNFVIEFCLRFWVGFATFQDASSFDLVYCGSRCPTRCV